MFEVRKPGDRHAQAGKRRRRLLPLLAYRKAESGFTMVETVVSVVVLALMIGAISSLFAFNLSEVALGKAKAIGLALANERMEYLRDLPYNSLATQNGDIYPPGNIQDDQTFIRGGYSFRVHTRISYVDDPYDGDAAGDIPGKPTDLYPYDYKRAEIIVYITGTNTIVSQLDTAISAKAAETSSNTGIIQVTVDNASGAPVPNASVHIYNPTPNPDVNIYTTSDNQGEVEIPQLPPDSANGYQITATLSGYSTDGTLAGQYATKENVNVISQQITSVTLTIDQLAQMSVHVQDTSGNPVASKLITATGLKTIYKAHGTTASTPKNVYTGTTDASGNVTFANSEWDGYNFTLPSGYYLVDTSPISPVTLQPNSNLSVTLVVSTNSAWPTITTISPATDTNDSPTSFTVTGTNFATGTTMQLQMTGQPTITGTGVTRSGTTSITGTFNITSVTTGAWDVVITSSTGTATQPGGFTVASP